MLQNLCHALFIFLCLIFFIRKAQVHKDSPVRPLNKKDSSAGDDEECLVIYFIRKLWEVYKVHKDYPVRPLIYFINKLREVYEVHRDSPVRALNKKDSSDGDDEKEVRKDSPVRPLNKKDSSDGDDEKEVQEDSLVHPLNKEDRSDGDDVKVSERTSPRKDDSDSFFSISDEDEESVGNTLSDNISEPVHNVSPNGSSRLRFTSWQKGGELGSGSFGTVYEGISKYDSFAFLFDNL
ncbi:uncharacterized protein LOC104452747 [Eucalyptus grandis]|uniref:uncharacterized protein LOC104452747 n=1 Tax=Eucalyptus grandis TaxID=71139 RepID=UPI00192ED9BE|nr:uncharacterized protein LOC104452747 [Eucalyptus grandis]